MKMETIRACSIWRALEVVGDVPVLLIMEQAFLGTHRFEEFVEKTGLIRSVVSNRLKKLVDSGSLIKTPDKSHSRRFDYRLTEMGHGQFPAALMILRWQHRWEPEQRGFKVRLVHRDCGHHMEPSPVCAQCHVEVDARAVSWAPGPGLTQVVPVYQRRRQQTASVGARRDAATLVDSVIELFGDRWSTLVVRACFTGINRFDDIQRDTQMASNILSGRLERLLGQGILRAVPYSAHQDRFEYRLTEKGRDFYPVLMALMAWGDRWFADEKGPPLILTHQPCSHLLHMLVVCSHCGGNLDTANTQFEFSH